MSKYEPQVGDKVRRTYPSGTTVEGVIARTFPGVYLTGESREGLVLFDSDLLEQTELLERPFKLNTTPGTVYGHRDNAAHRVVRVVGLGRAAWLGYVGDDDYHWYEDAEILGYINEAGWVEFNLDGSRKND